MEIVVDCVGSLLGEAVKIAGNSGRILLIGVDSGARANIEQLDVTSRELRLEGVFMMKSTMQDAVHLIEAGVLPFEQIVTHRLPMEEYATGIELARSGRAVKVVFGPFSG